MIQTHFKQINSPKAIIDYSNQPKKLIHQFKEIIYMDSNHNIFLNNQQIKGDALDVWQECLDRWKEDTPNNEIAALGFFAYNFKSVLYPDYPFKKNKDYKTPLFWFAKPEAVTIKENYKPYYSTQTLRLKKDFMNQKMFTEVINKIKDYLYNGDVYQINYTQELEFYLNGNPIDLYFQIQETAHAKYGFYINTGQQKFLSFSPEKFFKTKDNTIKTYPIKGTIKKTHKKETDRIQRLKLSNSEKDKAEHLMIVDLLRNDIGKVCNFGSVKVNDLFAVKTFPTIHHMESEIQGELQQQIQEKDIIKAVFPGGSITGAPKYRSMQIIDELEDYNRGIYTGCIGSIKKNGDMDFNICIRTMTIKDNIATYPIGGGIVWDSLPLLEYNEAKEKANIIVSY